MSEAAPVTLTLSDALWPAATTSESKALPWLRNGALVIGGVALMTIGAKLSFNTALSPGVPISMQSFAVLVIGMVLGWRLAASSVASYLALGLAGAPVFANLGAGPVYFMGPTGGYLLGFLAAAALVGYLAERGFDRTMSRSLIAMAAGTAVIFVPGVLWYSNWLGGNLSHAYDMGLLIYLPGEVIKIILAAAVLPAAWKFAGRKRG
ncbi:MAG: biotin transporter BioY [Sumerlaeia bacterium]